MKKSSEFLMFGILWTMWASVSFPSIIEIGMRIIGMGYFAASAYCAIKGK